MNELTAIRNALYNEVISAASFSASNTEKGRWSGQDVPSANLPKAVIYFENDEIEYQSFGPTRTLLHTCTWRIDVFTTSEATADGLVDEIEAALSDRTLTDATPETLKVEGAGTTAVNGSYTLQEALINGEPAWQSDAGYVIRYSGVDYEIKAGPATLYSIASDDPIGTYTVDTSGTAPAPTVTSVGNTMDLRLTGISYELSSEGDADYVRASLALTTEHTTTKTD